MQSDIIESEDKQKWFVLLGLNSNIQFKLNISWVWAFNVVDDTKFFFYVKLVPYLLINLFYDDWGVNMCKIISFSFKVSNILFYFLDKIVKTNDV